ncbi:MAG: hypothetical protein NC828_01235, partial [Candidatus Omnitrophica bacterium]|nr:hypothetical protein [Candidatus Omnitrophota bacterium]
DQELQNMVGLQAGKQLPYPASDLIWDFKVIDKRPDGYSDIFFTIVHRNVIDRFMNILANCKLSADRIILSSEALFGWYLAVSDSQTQGLSLTRTAVVDIDASYMDVLIIDGLRLEFSRTFPFKDAPEEMAQELGRTFFSYEKDSSKKISSVTLTGIEERAVKLKPFIESMYKDGKVDFIHPLKIIAMDYRETLAEYFDLAKDVSLAYLLGIAYNLKEITMDLLPSEKKAELTKTRKKKTLIKTALLLVAVICILFGIFIKWVLDTNKEISLINLKIREMEPQVKKLKEISQNMAIIKQHLNMKGSCVDIIREVYSIVPAGVSLSVLDFVLDESLLLRGSATDLSSVFKFSSDLEKSPYFEGCHIKYAQKRTT